MPYAVRSKTGRPFTRSGTTFPHERYLFIESLSDAQASDPALEILEISGPDDPILGPRRLVGSQASPADLLAGVVAERDALARQLEEAAEQIDTLTAERDALARQLEDAVEQIAALTAERDALIEANAKKAKG